MSRLLIIGCGGVAQVAIKKCCQNSEIFTEICIASRTKEKCDALKKELDAWTDTKVTTAKVDADCTDEVITLIREYQPDALIYIQAIMHVSEEKSSSDSREDSSSPLIREPVRMKSTG